MLLQIKKDKEEEGETPSLTRNCDCLLYTSDAADE